MADANRAAPRFVIAIIGADRIELCAALSEGGLTPSLGLVRMVQRAVTIPVYAMLRPRAGDFLYSPDDVAVLREDLALFKAAGVAGVVFGCLAPDGSVDADLTRALIALARPLPVTFHRAIDMAVDPLAAIDTLAALGVERILTSGGESTALEVCRVFFVLLDLSNPATKTHPYARRAAQRSLAWWLVRRGA